jgi:hypothetical protein
MPEIHHRPKVVPLKRFLQLMLLVWVAMLGVDFFIHGGLFAAVYFQNSPFLLPDREAFRRIPFGYLALLASAGFLTWILVRTATRGWRRGLEVGLSLGVVMGLSFTLGLFSISTASVQLLIASFLAQMLEMAVGGTIVGHGLQAHSLRGLALAVIIGFILLFVTVLVMQNVGLAPSTIGN